MTSSAAVAAIRLRAKLYQQVRQFFYERDTLEVETPLLTSINTAHDVWQAMAVQSALSGELKASFLQTSPMLAMKPLLLNGLNTAYQISKVFRDASYDRKHHYEFSLLSWYRAEFNLLQLMQEVSDLLSMVFESPVEPKILTYKQAFLHRLEINPLTADIKTLKDTARRVGLYENLADDRVAWLNLLFKHFVEPTLGMEFPVYLIDFPAEMMSHSRIKAGDDNQEVAIGFELYMDGLKVASAQEESLHEQDNVMTSIALGLDHLLMILLQTRRIDKVLLPVS